MNEVLWTFLILLAWWTFSRVVIGSVTQRRRKHQAAWEWELTKRWRLR